MKTMPRVFTPKVLFGIMGFLTITTVVRGMVVKYNAYLANEQVTFNKSYTIPLNSYGIDQLSFSAFSSSVTYTAPTFTDGQDSTGTITVTSNSGLVATAASDSLTVSTTTGMTSSNTITLNGVVLTQGLQWFSDNTTTATAINIMNAIAAYVPNVKSSTGTGSVVFATAAVVGSYSNNMTFSANLSTSIIAFATYTSSSAAGSSSQFTGGIDSATISIAGYYVGFTVGANSSSTALSIAQNINSNTSLSPIVVASVTDAGTVVYTTSTQVGAFTNYVVTSSSDAALTVNGSTKTVTGLNGASIGQMWGGLDSSIPLFYPSTTTKTIAITNHSLPLGLAVLLSTSGAHLASPLANNTTYYVIPATANSVLLAATSTGAQAGLALVYTSSDTSTSQTKVTLTPLGIAGVPSYQWQVSNDGMNWIQYSSNSYATVFSSVTLATSPYVAVTSTTWDFGPIDYAFIRLNVVSSTAGAIKLLVIGNGKNTSQ